MMRRRCSSWLSVAWSLAAGCFVLLHFVFEFAKWATALAVVVAQEQPYGGCALLGSNLENDLRPKQCSPSNFNATKYSLLTR